MWWIGNSGIETRRCPQAATLLAFVNAVAGLYHGANLEDAGGMPDAADPSD
jgi:hypothetical protein